MEFFFAVGIENSYIPELGVDQLSWTCHKERWREDLALAKEAGATHIRYGCPGPGSTRRPGSTSGSLAMRWWPNSSAWALRLSGT